MEQKQALQEYHEIMLQEKNERQEQIKQTLALVKTLVSEKQYVAITDWIKDEENSIWGKLEIVTKPKGEWQTGSEDEDGCYWTVLKGMYVDQYVGYCGDDYSGYLTVKLNETKYLQACFEL